MSILTTTTELKQYVSVASSFQFEDFSPYIDKAVNKFLKKYIGNLHETINDINADESDDDTEEALASATVHLQSAIANLGMYLYMPFATVLFESSGISNVQSDKRKAAEWWQIKDMRRELLRAGYESTDLLLEVLENNLDVFEDYAANYSSINNELIVNSASVFSKYYNINNSRQTYLALAPYLRLVEDQYIYTFLCDEIVAEIKKPIKSTGTLTDKQKEAKELKPILQKAIVNFTVSKVAALGVFNLEPTGLRLNIERLIDTTNKPIESGMPMGQIRDLERELISNGSNYLQQAKTYIESSDLSTLCDDPFKNSSEDDPSGFKPINTTGITAI